MAEELREALEKAYDTEATDFSDTKVEEPPESPPPVTEAPTTPAPVVEQESKPAVETPAPTEPPSSVPRIDRAPASWKGEAKKVWETLPLQIRQEVIRRERHVEQVQREHAADRQQVQHFHEAVAPYQNIVQQSYGGDTVNAVRSLLEVERILTTAPTQQKAQFVANLIKHYQVDVMQLDAALSGQMAPEQQQVSQIDQLLNQKLAPIMGYFQQQQLSQRQQAQQVEQQAVVTVEQMAADTEQYPYFDDVREAMADIIEMQSRRGVFVDLPTAYQKAVRMDDSLSQLMDTRSQANQQTQQALAAHQAAQRAKGAAVSVGGVPSAAGASQIDPNDLRALLDAQLNGSAGRL